MKGALLLEHTQDIFLEHFQDPRFQKAFQQYFSFLGVKVRDWEGLFREMDQDGRGNRAYLRLNAAGETVGFIQFCPMELSGWFFQKRLGFIRELWVAPACQGQGHGSALLALAEGWFREQGFSGSILTTDTAPGFYEKPGYRLDPGITAKNCDPAYGNDLGNALTP